MIRCLLARLREQPAFVFGTRKVRVGASTWLGPVQGEFSLGRAVPHHFLSPQSLETRTSLSHPRRPRPCQGPADGGGRLPVEERKQHPQLFCVGPTAKARAAGKGHVVTRAVPLGLSPDPLEQSTAPWASGFRPQRLFPHHQMKSLGTDRVEREPGSSAHHPSSSIPPPEASGHSSPAQPFPASLRIL